MWGESVDNNRGKALHCNALGQRAGATGKTSAGLIHQGEITAVAKFYGIDYADEGVRARLRTEQISAIDKYCDFAEWQYDLKNGAYRFRKLRGLLSLKHSSGRGFQPIENRGMVEAANR